MQISELVGAENKELVLDDRSPYGAAGTVVVERRLPREGSSQNGSLRQVIERVVISVLVVPLARPVPSVRSSLRDQTELAARGMPVLRAELIRREVEFRDRIWNHCGIISGHAQIVVVHAIYCKVVVARTCSTHR